MPNGTWYNKDDGLWYRTCPNCEKPKGYVSKYDMARWHHKKTFCKSCARRTGKIYKNTFTFNWYNRFKNGSKLRLDPNGKHKWELSMEDVYQVIKRQKGKCFYTGEKLDFQVFGEQGDITASIDRVNSDVNYTKENICICLKEINLMKGSMDIQRFLVLCEKIADKDNKDWLK